VLLAALFAVAFGLTGEAVLVSGGLVCLAAGFASAAILRRRG
jgi:hypothetical protein